MSTKKFYKILLLIYYFSHTGFSRELEAACFSQPSDPTFWRQRASRRLRHSGAYRLAALVFEGDFDPVPPGTRPVRLLQGLSRGRMRKTWSASFSRRTRGAESRGLYMARTAQADRVAAE